MESITLINPQMVIHTASSRLAAETPTNCANVCQCRGSGRETPMHDRIAEVGMFPSKGWIF